MHYLFFLLSFFFLFHAGKCQPLKTLKGHKLSVTSVSFSPDGQTFVTGSADHTAILWNIEGKLLLRFKGHSQDVQSVAISPNGKWLVTGSIDMSIRLWDLSGNCVRIFHDTTLHEGKVAFEGLKSQMEQYLLSKHMLSTQDTARRRQRDRQAATPISLLAHSDAVSSVAFSPDGTRILSASKDKTAKIWDLEGHLLLVLQNKQASIQSAAFSPDGQQVITGSQDGAVVLWNEQGKLEKTFSHPDMVYSVAFSPDGKFILTACFDKQVRIWSLSGEVQLSLPHPMPVLCARFSPDGTSVATGSTDHTAKCWDRQGNLLATFGKAPSDSFFDSVNAVVFSPEGSRLLTTHKAGVVKLWKLDRSNFK